MRGLVRGFGKGFVLGLVGVNQGFGSGLTGVWQLFGGIW